MIPSPWREILWCFCGVFVVIACANVVPGRRFLDAEKYALLEDTFAVFRKMEMRLG